MAIRSTSRGRIPEMDGLRALAIGAVMIEHFAGGPIRHILPWGAFGVQPFFALSGFLITSLLLEGGPRLAGSFLDAREIDEVRLFVAPIVLGGRAAPAPFEGEGTVMIADAQKAASLEVETVDEDVLITARLREW